MITQTDAVKQAWAATDRTLDIVVTVDGKDYQATEINSLNYNAGAFTGDTLGIGSNYENSVTVEFSSVIEALKQGLTVLPRIGILVDGKFEYTKLGTFIISEVNRDRNNNLTTIKALDQMCKLEGQYKPTVSGMASPLDIIADIANQGGVTVNTGELQHLPTLPNIKKIEGQTLRTAIGWVAQFYDGFATFDRDGKLTIRTTATPDYTISPSEYQQGGLTKNEVAYKTGGIKVTVNSKTTDDSGQETDSTQTLQAGETTGSQIELTNDVMTESALATIWNGIKDITYYPYTLNWFGNPGLEAGDWVTLTDTQGNQFNVPVNGYTMAFNGGLESTISATQTSSAAGGYAYTGSAGSIKNMIEALQVRHTASGNNVYPPSYQGQPKSPKKGDVWYKQNGNNVEVWIYQEDDGKLTWVRTPLDGEVKAELQALGKKTDEDLTRVKNEISSTAESQWESAKTAISETDQRLTSLQAEQNASLADLHNTADSLHSEVKSLHADADSMRGSLADTRASLIATTSKVNNDLTSIKSSLSGVENDLSATKTSLADTGNRLAMATSEFQRQTGQLSGSLSTANSMIKFNSDAIAEVKRTAEEISTTVSNIRVGGRNLLRNTKTLNGVWNGDTETVDGFTVAKATDTITGGSYDLITWSNLTNIKSNTDYTLTFYAKASKATGIYSYLYNIGTDTVYSDGSTKNYLTTDYKRYVVHFHTSAMPAGRTVNCLPMRMIEPGVTGYIYGVQLEEGNTATQWQPAPEDTDQAISKVSQTADAIRADLTNTKGDVASVKATASSLQSQITDNKNNISSVKQTAEGLQSSVTDQSGKISQLQQDAKGLTATVANGGQNLILNSGNPSTLEHWLTTGKLTLRKHSFWKNGTENLFVLSNTSSTNEVLLSCERFAIEPNQDYTLSFYAFNDSKLLNADVWYLPRKSGSSNNWDEAIVLANFVKFSTGNAQYVKITFNSGDYNEGYIRFDNNGSTTEGTRAGLYLTDIQLEKGKIATAWSNSPGDIAQLKLTADGLTSKVADTQGNVSKLEQTASGLQTQITNTKDDVASVKVTADSVRTDLTNANHDIASVKAKADSLTSSMANANNQISTLQQRADSITTTLSQGGSNLLNNSQGNFQPKYSVIDNYQRFEGVNVYMTEGRKYTVSAQSAPGFAFDSYHNTSTESNRILLWLVDNNVNQIISSNTTDISLGGTHFTWNYASGTYTLRVNSYRKDNSGYAYHVQIEYGDTATPWKPSNGDISSLQQTASSLTSDMKDAKGNISTLQQTAGGLTSRVGNAEENISSVQQTAKELKATVGDDKTGLVSTVNAMPGKITSAITASKQATVITSAVDVHNMTTAGYYLLKGALTNSPVDAWAFLRVITSDSGDRIYHRIWKDNESVVYTEEWTGNWSGWTTHINSDNLKSNVITAINQSTEGVSITGNKITLDGNVNVAPGFTLSADHIKAGTLSADRISGGTLNFSNITVNGLTANSISSGSISGQNLNINLDNGVVEFTKGNLHSTDGGFNISIDTKSFYLDMGNDTKLWIDGNGYHLQESATQHLWMNKDGLHNYTDANGNGLWINDTELRILNSKNAGLVAKDGMLQFSANPTWNSPNVYSGSLNSQTYGTIGFNSNLLSSSLNGIFIKGREGVVIGTNSYDGGSLFGADSFLDVGQAGSGINLPDDLNKPASMFTKSALTLLGGPTYPASWGMSDKARISIGCDTYYSHSGASMYSGGNNARGNNISINARNTNIIGYDWVNIKCRNGRVALDGQYVHSYPTYNKTTSAGANVYVADDGALVRSSSARKYKTDIQDTDNDYGNKLIEFTPQKWIDKAEKKRYEEDPENNKKPGYYYGLIADDLDAAGLDMLVNYGAEGEVEGINYDRLAVALLPVIKSLKDQVASLKKQIKELAK